MEMDDAIEWIAAVLTLSDERACLYRFPFLSDGSQSFGKSYEKSNQEGQNGVSSKTQNLVRGTKSFAL